MNIREEAFVSFECVGCGSPTTLHGQTQEPDDHLCPPCHFFGPDWEQDERVVEIVDGIQNRNHQ